MVDSPSKLAREQLYEYLLPKILEDQAKIGALVTIPFGSSLTRGLVIHKDSDSTSRKDNFELKTVFNVLQESIFPSEYLDLLLWVGEFYLCDLWSTLKGVLPMGLFTSFQERLFLIQDNSEQPHLISDSEAKIVKMLDLSKEKSLTTSFLKQKLQDKQFRTSVNKLIEKGIVEKKIVIRKSVQKVRLKEENLIANKPIHLSPHQESVLKSIKSSLKSNEARRFLIHGVTGSGKTEVYFEAARETLKRGKQVIYLLPEISLSVQLLQRVKAAFPHERITLWHSNLSEGQRLQAWKDCLDGTPRIIVGARSAIFAPVNNLGLVIIDEEHDSSYKSGSKPFYDARVVAWQRAQLSKAVLVSGSATPSVASYKAALEENHLLELTERFHGLDLPKVEIVDMKLEMNDGNRSIFSRKLNKALLECVAKKEQAILLLNRRGHSSYVFCRDCAHVVYCDHCSVPMIYHATDNSLRCHHCNDYKPIVKECPACSSPKIKQAGLGTQRLEMEVKKHFPEAEVIRLDRDVSAKRHGMQEVWEKLTGEASEERCQILVGTQLVAKGIDLQRVALVGVVHSEAGLYLPDFTAAERTFQLLTQAAGRAGRHDKAGRVIFQTYVPAHWVVELAAKQDYKNFYLQEIEERRKYTYPPFTSFCRVIVSSEKAEIAEQDTLKMKKLIQSDFPSVQFLGPAPCPIERINKLFRWHLLIKFDGNEQLKHIHNSLQNTLKLRSRVNFDVLPISLL